MHPYEAKQLALRLMCRHGLRGWSFKFDSARRRFGSCQAHRKLITLSRPLTLLNSVSQVRETILHEIAHALTPGDGHGPRWKAKCREIGASPQRCYDDQSVKSPPRAPAEYEYGCRSCDWWHERRRLTESRYLCARCNGRVVYRERATGHLFLVRENGHGRCIEYIASA